MVKEREQHYVVSRDDQGPLYVGCAAKGSKPTDTSSWFITRDRNQAKGVNNQLEAREIADELNGKAIEPVYNLTDPEKRRWVVVDRIG